MLSLIAGLIIFIGAHSIRIVSEAARERLLARLGPLPYKALIALASIVGLVLIVHGYSLARADPVALWSPWNGGRHVAALLSLVGFVLMIAAYVPRNAIRARLGHPMVLGVKLWAFGHLFANHTLADLVLFASLLAWAALSFRAARRRDAQARLTESASERPIEPRPTGSRWADLAVIMIGCGAYWAFAFHLHARLIGVRPFG